MAAGAGALPPAAPPAGPPPNPPPGVIPSCVKQVCIACAVAGSWKLGLVPAVKVIPAFFKHAVSAGLENAPPRRPVSLVAAGEAAGAGALEVAELPLEEDCLPVVVEPEAGAPMAAPPAAPVSETRAASPAVSEDRLLYTSPSPRD